MLHLEFSLLNGEEWKPQIWIEILSLKLFME